MSDLISRQAAIEAFEKELTIAESNGKCVTIASAVTFTGAKQILEGLPSIDAVPVIRCRYCKHYHTHDHRCKVWNHGVKREEFCSRGERKDDPSHPFADDVMMG